MKPMQRNNQVIHMTSSQTWSIKKGQEQYQFQLLPTKVISIPVDCEFVNVSINPSQHLVWALQSLH